MENAVESLNKLQDMANQMLSGGSPVGNQFVFSRLTDSLPSPAYEVTKQIPGVIQPLSRDVLISQLTKPYSALRVQWGFDSDEATRGGGGGISATTISGSMMSSDSSFAQPYLSLGSTFKEDAGGSGEEELEDAEGVSFQQWGEEEEEQEWQEEELEDPGVGAKLDYRDIAQNGDIGASIRANKGLNGNTVTTFLDSDDDGYR
eukprot:g10806.t1